MTPSDVFCLVENPKIFTTSVKKDLGSKKILTLEAHKLENIGNFLKSKVSKQFLLNSGAQIGSINTAGNGGLRH